jgi:ribosomal RNA-processing protein 1
MASKPTKAASKNQLRFGNKLASNDKKTRDKAVKVLEKWLSSKQDISEADLNKIWKALFYCVWMSDKPLIQHELARKLAALLHVLPSEEQRLYYVRAFFLTMNREWRGIDRYRLDKFYALVRYFLNECFKLLKARDWNEEVVQKFVEIMIDETAGPLNILSCTQGVVYHLSDIYFDELGKVVPDYLINLKAETVKQLFTPWVHFLAGSFEKVMRNRVKREIFDSLLEQWNDFIDNKRDNFISREQYKSSEDETDGMTKEQKQTLRENLGKKFSAYQSALNEVLKEISKTCFQYASDPATTEGGRTMLYEMKLDLQRKAMKLTLLVKKRKADDLEDSNDQETESKEEKQPAQKKSKQANGSAKNVKANNTNGTANNTNKVQKNKKKQQHQVEQMEVEQNGEDNEQEEEVEQQPRKVVKAKSIRELKKQATKKQLQVNKKVKNNNNGETEHEENGGEAMDAEQEEDVDILTISPGRKKARQSPQTSPKPTLPATPMRAKSVASPKTPSHSAADQSDQVDESLLSSAERKKRVNWALHRNTEISLSELAKQAKKKTLASPSSNESSPKGILKVTLDF